MGNKIRLYGAPSGGEERWKGAMVLPAKLGDFALAMLERQKQVGEIGRYTFRRVGGLYYQGRGQVVIWQGPVPKRERPVCRARTRQGGQCRAKAVAGKERCRMHGGLSTGAKTAEGRARIAESNRRRAQARRLEKLEKPTGGV